MKLIKELLNDIRSCQKIFINIFPKGELQKVYKSDESIVLEGEDGDMYPNFSILRLYYDGEIIVERMCGGTMKERSFNSFEVVDLIRSLGYSDVVTTDVIVG